jgi:ribosomal protein L37AE/L43A
MPSKRSLRLTDCLTVLELHGPASRDQIKRAYRRLAIQLHPDRHPHNPHAQSRFIELNSAYRVLMDASAAMAEGVPVGVCQSCSSFGEVKQGTDGMVRCRRCLLTPAGGRLIPVDEWVVVKFSLAISFFLAEVVLFATAVVTDKTHLGLIAALAGMAGMAALAGTCLKTIFCITPQERSQQMNAPSRASR